MQGLSLISRAKLQDHKPEMKEWDKVGQHGTIWNTLSHSVGKIRPTPTTDSGQNDTPVASASAVVRLLFDYESNNSRSIPEGLPKRSRSSLEPVSKTSRTISESVPNNSQPSVEALKPPLSYTFFDHLVEVLQVITVPATDFPRVQFPLFYKPVVGRATNTQDLPYLFDIQQLIALKAWFLFFQGLPGVVILSRACFF